MAIEWLSKAQQKIIAQRRELISYLIFGVLTTLVNVGLFQSLLWVQLDYRVANLIALVGAKTFAYVTNKIFVFQSKTPHIHQKLGELFRFVLARSFTGFVDYFGLIFLVEILSADAVISKWALQVVVIVLNYIMGKKLVFTQSKINTISGD